VLYARRDTDHDHVAALSTMAQTCGYLIGATGPVLAAVLYSATGSWSAPLAAVTATLLLGGALSMRAADAGALPGRSRLRCGRGAMFATVLCAVFASSGISAAKIRRGARTSQPMPSTSSTL